MDDKIYLFYCSCSELGFVLYFNRLYFYFFFVRDRVEGKNREILRVICCFKGSDVERVLDLGWIRTEKIGGEIL